MRQESKTIINQTTAADIASEVIDLRQCFAWAVQYAFSGATPTGSLIIECSNDGENFAPAVAAISITATGSAMVNLPDIGYAYGRVTYDYTSGASLLVVSFSKKGA